MIILPPLPYPSDALVPVLSETTLQIHHGKHHKGYVDKANALRARAGLANTGVEALIATAAAASDRELFNNLAQAWNHAFFWNSMSPHPVRPTERLREAIRAAFGSPEGLRRAFIEEGVRHLGSGWIWLTVQDGRLALFSTHDADTVVTRNVTPLLACDVWEHAYYLDHRNDRAAYLALWWDGLANWDFAQRQFDAEAAGSGAWTYPREAEAYVAPIHGTGAFEHALEEAGMLLALQPTAGSEHGRRFDALLNRIAEYEPAAPPVGQAGRVSADLDRRIRAAARRATARDQAEAHHWSPLVGGDLRLHV